MGQAVASCGEDAAPAVARIAEAAARALNLEICMVDLPEEKRPTAYFIADPALAELLDEVVRRYPVRADEGPIARVLASQRPLLMRDLRRSRLLKRAHRELAPAGLWALMLPLCEGGCPRGVMTLVGRWARSRPPGRRVAQALAEAACSALRHARLLRESERRSRALSTLTDAGALLTTGDTLETRLGALTRALTTASGFEVAEITVYSPRSRETVLRHGWARDNPEMLAAWQRAAAPWQLRLAEARSRAQPRPWATNDIEAEQGMPPPIRKALLGSGFRSGVGVPLIYGGEFVGMLFVGSRRAGAFSPEDLSLLDTLGSQVAAAVKNALLLERLEESLGELKTAHLESVSLLAAAVEARDPYTGDHLQRIRALSDALAANLGVPDETVEQIGHASLLHDLGKVAVPDAVLAKPGPLIEEEWDVIRRHPLVGERLLGSSAFYETARAVARWHHERWDGHGYPDRLRGEEIPLAARIVSVADVLDALTSRRPYKEAWPLDRAVAEIRRVKGSQLDPSTVEVLLDLYQGGHLEGILRGPPKLLAA